MPPCAVCSAPDVGSTLHFGVSSCKACAAFFRRSVTARTEHKCVTGAGACLVRHDMRMFCRACRWQRCIEAGMRTDLVQPKRGRQIDCVVVDDTTEHETFYSRMQQQATSYPPPQPPPPSAQQQPIVDHQYMEVAAFECVPSTSVGNAVAETSSSLSWFNNNDIESPESSETSARNRHSFSRGDSRPSLDDDLLDRVLRRQMLAECELNRHRRLRYAHFQLPDMFEEDDDTLLECPYTRADLRPCPLSAYHGATRTDLLFLLDYVKMCDGYPSLCSQDKAIFYRFLVAVDSIIGIGYLSYRIGHAERLLIHVNGMFLPMDPPPPQDPAPFGLKGDDAERYKTFRAMKIQQYQDVAIPIEHAALSFQEFVLLKAIAVWHCCHFKLSASGRDICQRQRDRLVRALFHVVETSLLPTTVDSDDGLPVVEERVGQLLLLISCIFEATNRLIEDYVKISFFDLANVDPLIRTMVAFRYDREDEPMAMNGVVASANDDKTLQNFL